MKHARLRSFGRTPTLLAMILLAGCTRDVQDARLSRVTEQALEQQTRQNQAMAELQKNLQVERTHLDQERAKLEEDARQIAANRHRDPLIAGALVSVAGLLVAALPLGLCWHLLRGLYHPGDNGEALGELLVQEMTSSRPLILPPLLDSAAGHDDGSQPILPPPEPPELPAPEPPSM